MAVDALDNPVCRILETLTEPCTPSAANGAKPEMLDSSCETVSPHNACQQGLAFKVTSRRVPLTSAHQDTTLQSQTLHFGLLSKALKQGTLHAPTAVQLLAPDPASRKQFRRNRSDNHITEIASRLDLLEKQLR